MHIKVNTDVAIGYLPLIFSLHVEPDLFPEVTNTTVVKVDQLVKDFEALKHLLAKLGLNPKYVAGPDVATLTRNDYFERYAIKYHTKKS